MILSHAKQQSKKIIRVYLCPFAGAWRFAIMFANCHAPARIADMASFCYDYYTDKK
jgi:hypothetical protein